MTFPINLTAKCLKQLRLKNADVSIFHLNRFIPVTWLFSDASVSKIVKYLQAYKHAEFGSFIIKRTIPFFNILTIYRFGVNNKLSGSNDTRHISAVWPISSPEPARFRSAETERSWTLGQSITGNTVLSFRVLMCVHALSMRRGNIRGITKSHRRWHRHRLFFAPLSFSLMMQHAMVSVPRPLA